MSTDVVQPDSRLLVHFILLLADGSVAESTRASGKPALFRLGDGSLSPALEAELLGLAAGAKHQFTLRSDQAYGESNPELIQYFPKRDFMQSGEPKVGAIILFSAMDGSELPGIVRQISGDSVTVDFNHPLAGQDITFQLEVLEINLAAEEINANFTG